MDFGDCYVILGKPKHMATFCGEKQFKMLGKLIYK